MASEVVVGDVLIGVSDDGSPAPQEVTVLMGGLQPCMRVIHERGDFTCSESHQVMTASDGALTVTGLEVEGHRLLDERGTPLSIMGILSIGHSMVYGWTCEPNHVFYAGGILHHNKSKSVISASSTIADGGLPTQH